MITIYIIHHLQTKKGTTFTAENFFLAVIKFVPFVPFFCGIIILVKNQMESEEDKVDLICTIKTKLKFKPLNLFSIYDIFVYKI